MSNAYCTGVQIAHVPIVLYLLDQFAVLTVSVGLSRFVSLLFMVSYRMLVVTAVRYCIHSISFPCWRGVYAAQRGTDMRYTEHTLLLAETKHSSELYASLWGVGA